MFPDASGHVTRNQLWPRVLAQFSAVAISPTVPIYACVDSRKSPFVIAEMTAVIPFGFGRFSCSKDVACSLTCQGLHSRSPASQTGTKEAVDLRGVVVGTIFPIRSPTRDDLCRFNCDGYPGRYQTSLIPACRNDVAHSLILSPVLV